MHFPVSENVEHAEKQAKPEKNIENKSDRSKKPERKVSKKPEHHKHNHSKPKKLKKKR